LFWASRQVSASSSFLGGAALLALQEALLLVDHGELAVEVVLALLQAGLLGLERLALALGLLLQGGLALEELVLDAQLGLAGEALGLGLGGLDAALGLGPELPGVGPDHEVGDGGGQNGPAQGG